MRVLISGGRGFIGAWTARALIDRGYQVTSLDLAGASDLADAVLGDRKEAINWCTGDVTRRQEFALAAQSCDAIIHLAGLLTPACQRAPVLGAEVNVIGALNAFEIAKEKGIDRVIYASSVSVFGPERSDHPFPTTHYGAFKLAVEGCARAYFEEDGISSFGFRPAVVYGVGRETGLTAGLTEACRAAAKSLDFSIDFAGEVPVVYVEDVARVISDALTAPSKGAYACNLVGDVVTVDRFVSEIQKTSPSSRISVSGPQVPFSVSSSTDPVTTCLPGFRYTSLAEGVRSTIESFRGG